MATKRVTVNKQVVEISAPDDELVPYMVGMALREHYGQSYNTMRFEAIVSSGGKSYKAVGNGNSVKISLVV